MATSMASARSRSMAASEGVMARESRATPSKRATCSRTYASPRARTPAMAASATRRASSFDSLRRASMARSAPSASAELALNGCIRCLLDSSDQLPDALRLGAIDVLADDQSRRDFGHQVLDLELVDAHRLAGLDEIDYMGSESEDGRQLDGAAEGNDLPAKLALVEVGARHARVLRGDLGEAVAAQRRRARRADDHHPAASERQLDRLVGGALVLEDLIESG